MVYDHFPNLNRLLHAVIEREERIALEQLAEVVPDDPGDHDPGELLAAGVSRFLDAVTSRPATRQIILLPLEGTPALVRPRGDHSRTRPRPDRGVVRWALEQSDSAHDLDAELTARTIRDWSERAGRMVPTDPEHYRADRYGQFVKRFLKLFAPPSSP